MKKHVDTNNSNSLSITYVSDIFLAYYFFLSLPFLLSPSVFFFYLSLPWSCFFFFFWKRILLYNPALLQIWDPLVFTFWALRLQVYCIIWLILFLHSKLCISFIIWPVVLYKGKFMRPLKASSCFELHHKLSKNWSSTFSDYDHLIVPRTPISVTPIILLHPHEVTCVPPTL